MQEFLDSGSENGVILFTMGFAFQPWAVPNSRIQAMFDAFAKLPQKVIMKLDDISQGYKILDLLLLCLHHIIYFYIGGLNVGAALYLFMYLLYSILCKSMKFSS